MGFVPFSLSHHSCLPPPPFSGRSLDMTEILLAGTLSLNSTKISLSELACKQYADQNEVMRGLPSTISLFAQRVSPK